MLALHAQSTLIVATIVGNALLALWAFLTSRRGRRTLGSGFWTVLLVVLAVMALQMAAGVVLALGGARPRSWLHFLYAVLVSGLGIYQFGLRPGGFVRAQSFPLFGADPHSASGMALICLTQAALVARAYTTGAFGR